MSDQLLTIALLLAAGLVLAALEVFVIPGLGVTAVLAALLLLIGSLLSFVWFGAEAGALAASIAVVGPVLLVVGFARSASGKKLVLGSSLKSQPEAGSAPQVRVGDEGRALSPLRPSGSAQLGELRVDVVTEGSYVEAGEPLRVIEVSGTRVVVERLAPEPQPSRKP